MNTIKKLLAENTNNAENINAIKSAIENESLNFDGVSVEINGTEIEFHFTQEWRDYNADMNGTQTEILISAANHLRLYNPELF